MLIFLLLRQSIAAKRHSSLRCELFKNVNMNFDLIQDRKNRVHTVRELNFSVKQLLENNLPLLWVRG